MAYIGRGIENFSQIEVLDIITFTTSAGPYNILKGAVAFIPSTVNSLLIEVDGIIQAPASYTVDGSTITFGVSMPSTSTMNSMIHFGTGLITTPADGSVTAAKIASDAVTTAKILDNNVTVAKLPTTLDISSNTVTLPASVSGLGTGITNAQLAGSIDVTSKITGTIPTANLGSGSASASTYLAGDQSYKTITAYNDDALQNDIATLALHQATNANAAKYNLANTNVDVYQDSTGISALTNCVRDTSGEYVSSITPGDGIDANTVYLLSLDNNLTDTSGNSITTTNNNSATFSTTVKKFGTHSALFNGSNQWLSTGDLSSGLTNAFPTTGDFTVDFWAGYVSRSGTDRLFAIGNNGAGGAGSGPVVSAGIQGAGPSNGMNTATNAADPPNFDINEAFAINATWEAMRHYAFQRTGTTAYVWIDGAVCANFNYPTGWSGINLMANDKNVQIAIKSGAASEFFNGYIDEFRISNNSRYTGGSSFTPPTTAYTAEVVNATGNYVSTATTANASVSKVGIVMTYKNNAGTNTLNTDIVAQVSADGGSNYSTVTLAAAGTFSTGVLQAVANDVSVTPGTNIQYKISFANQASGSKEARITGASLIY